ncbi:MAG: XRE family transcriptional regulator [Flavobacteriia bacterium]|jgi:transcriptional regulator with XRE-family HTH domain
MQIGTNLKVLRKHFGNSQEEMATLLKLTRSSYSGYENNVAEPSIATLVLLSGIYGISLDIILKKDLSTFSDEELNFIFSDQSDLKGQNLRILTSVVNEDNEELIEMIPEKARAGYSLGYSDPEYLKILPTFSLPFLSKDRKYRSFPIKGDSMPPVSEGSFVVAEYIQNWMLIKNETPCIVVTKEDGIVFKIVYNHLTENQTLVLHSTNPLYLPYEVNGKDIIEIWKFVNYISPDLPEIKLDDQQLNKSIQNIQKEISEIKLHLKK